MANQSDVILKNWNALPKAGEPEGWRRSPILDAWRLETSPNDREVAVVGIVSGSEKFPNGHTIRTSALGAVDGKQRFVLTQNSTYRLGWPARESLEADADGVWPPALCVASNMTWQLAISKALFYTGEHTLSQKTVHRATVAHDDGDWAERRIACKAVADELKGQGRTAVTEAWWILATDLTVAADRHASATLVRAAAERAWMNGQALSVEEALADYGWKLLAGMDDAQFEKLKREGVPIDDPIGVAQCLAATLTVGFGPHRPDAIARPPADEVNKEPDDENPNDDDLGAKGVVVLREVGGIDNSWTREVRRALKPIVGVKLPLTPVPDLAAVRRTLAAEFPYARAQIDTVLSDLVGARHVKLRPTIFTGPTGSGKSRLCRRIGYLLGLHVTRNDCAAYDDNTFAGTPRRWSSGEPSAPVRAMLAAKRADGLIVCDELDKTGISRSHGRMQDALLAFLERDETGVRFMDPFVQSEVDCSNLSFFATANDPSALDAPLRDRFRMLRIPPPTRADLPALCRGIVRDLAGETGLDERWMPDLDGEELWMAERLWKPGSVRRLREIVARIVAKRPDMPRH